jgi:hypothetical protein
MGAFKQFLSTDVTVVPFVVNKSFSFIGSASLVSSSIERLLGSNIDPSSSLAASILITSSVSASQVYNSVKQLYYTNYIPTPSQSQAPNPVYDYNGKLVSNYASSATNARFYNYEQTSLFQTNSAGYVSNFGFERYFPTESEAEIGVLSIPKNIFGDYINPSTFVYKYNIGSDITIYDNGEGLLYKSGSTDFTGIINYAHGIIVLTSGSLTTNFTGSNDVTCSFQSSRTIYETQYKCTIKPDEFNYSFNPSLQPTGSAIIFSGSTWTNYTSSNNGTLRNFATGSYFSPYITTIGLYDENQELLAVAKLGQPLPTSRTTDTTIIINLDR